MKLFISKLDWSILESIVDSVNKIVSYTCQFKNAKEFFENEQVFDATIMNFIVIGEMVARLSDSFKSNVDNIDWVNIIGLRNIIAHDYFGIDADEVWQVINNDLLLLKEQIIEVLNLSQIVQ